MSVKVRIPTQLRPLTGGAPEIEGTGTTVAEIISSIDRTYPGVAQRLLDEDGTLRRFLNLYLDDEDIRYLQGLDSEASQASQLTIITSVAGGSR